MKKSLNRNLRMTLTHLGVRFSVVGGLGLGGLMSMANAQAQTAVPAPAGSAAAPGQPGQPGFVGMVMPFALMFGVFYFLMIRPQQKKMKEQKEMMSALKAGDEILTASGFLGKIVSVADQVATVDLGDNVKVRILKSQISQVVKGGLETLKAAN